MPKAEAPRGAAGFARDYLREHPLKGPAIAAMASYALHKITRTIENIEPPLIDMKDEILETFTDWRHRRSQELDVITASGLVELEDA